MRGISHLVLSWPVQGLLLLAAAAYLAVLLTTVQPPLRATPVAPISEVAGAFEAADAETIGFLGIPVFGPRAIASLDVHIGPGDAYAVVGSIPKDALLNVAGRDESGEWLAIVFTPESRFRGWVPRDQVRNVDDERLKVTTVTPLGLP
jgi:hypothetical protein